MNLQYHSKIPNIYEHRNMIDIYFTQYQEDKKNGWIISIHIKGNSMKMVQFGFGLVVSNENRLSVILSVVCL